MIDMAPEIDRQTTDVDAVPIDRELLADEVWHDMRQTVPRAIVAQTIDQLLAKYDDVAIQTFVPMLVRREARGLLRSVNLTEIEAKFKVTDPQLFRQLQTINELAGHELSPPRSKPVWDTYLDSARRRILREGFSCRQRETRDGIEMALKSLARPEGPIHHRNEWQVMLLAIGPPAEWPESQVRDRVLRIISTEPLLPLFRLEQTRIIRQLQMDGQPLAELSMDSVGMADGDPVHIFHELEIELLPTAPKGILVEIVQNLQEQWQLEAEPLSKFERGLALLDAAS